jgi:hypothetical protein
MIGAFCAVTLNRIAVALVHHHRRNPDRLPREPAEGRNALCLRPGSARRWEARSSTGRCPSRSCFNSDHDADRPVHGTRLIKHFYKRPHADQILVTFGLAIVLQEIIKYFYGANPIPTPAPEVFAGSFDFGALIGMIPISSSIRTGGSSISLFATVIIGGVFAFLQFTTFGMVVRAGMADRQTVACSASISTGASPSCSPRRRVAGLAGVMYTPINSPNYHMGMDFLSQLRGGCCRRHGLVAGRGARRFPARHPGKLRVHGTGARPARASTRSSSISLPSSSCSPVRGD